MGPTVTQRTRGPARGILCARRSGRDWRGVSARKIPVPGAEPCAARGARSRGGVRLQSFGHLRRLWRAAWTGDSGAPKADYEACRARCVGNLMRRRELRPRTSQRAETLTFTANTPIRAVTRSCGGTGYPASSKGAGGSRRGDCATNSEEILESTSSTPIEPNRKIADALSFK